MFNWIILYIYILQDHNGTFWWLTFTQNAPDSQTEGRGSWQQTVCARKAALLSLALSSLFMFHATAKRTGNDSEEKIKDVLRASHKKYTTPKALSTHSPLLSQKQRTSLNRIHVVWVLCAEKHAWLAISATSMKGGDDSNEHTALKRRLKLHNSYSNATDSQVQPCDSPFNFQWTLNEIFIHFSPFQCLLAFTDSSLEVSIF